MRQIKCQFLGFLSHVKDALIPNLTFTSCGKVDPGGGERAVGVDPCMLVSGVRQSIQATVH